jgi:uncharacterized membrane protein
MYHDCADVAASALQIAILGKTNRKRTFVMGLMLSGLLLWSLAHLFPSVMSTTRTNTIGRLGNNRYRGIFSLVIVASLFMIVYGWKSTLPAVLYAPPLLGSLLPALLLLIAFILLVAAQTRSNIRRVIRHPQLTGVAIWGIAHLLSNGDTRSVVLFGAMTFWSILTMLFSSRRDGEWKRPEPVAVSSDIATVAGGAVGFCVLLYAHQTLFGVSPLPF